MPCGRTARDSGNDGVVFSGYHSGLFNFLTIQGVITPWWPVRLALAPPPVSGQPPTRVSLFNFQLLIFNCQLSIPVLDSRSQFPLSIRRVVEAAAHADHDVAGLDVTVK
jgi:hypothetical protein